MSGPAVKLPGLLGKIGKKQIALASQWVGSAIGFGATAGLAVLYGTDWRAVVDYIPYYNGKFPKEEES